MLEARGLPTDRRSPKPAEKHRDRDNAGSEVEPLLEAYGLPTDRGSLEPAEKKHGDSYRRGGGNPN